MLAKRKTVRNSDESALASRDQVNINVKATNISLRSSRKRNLVQGNTALTIIDNTSEKESEHSELNMFSDKPAKSAQIGRSSRLAERRKKELKYTEELTLYEIPVGENKQQVVKKRNRMKQTNDNGKVSAPNLKKRRTGAVSQHEEQKTENQRNSGDSSVDKTQPFIIETKATADNMITSKDKSLQETGQAQAVAETSKGRVENADTTFNNVESLLEHLCGDENFGFGQNLSENETIISTRLLSGRPKPWRFCISTFRPRNFHLRKPLNKPHEYSVSSLHSEQHRGSKKLLLPHRFECILTKTTYNIPSENISRSQDKNKLQNTKPATAVSAAVLCPPPLSTKVPKSKASLSASRASTQATVPSQDVSVIPAYNQQGRESAESTSRGSTRSSKVQSLQTCDSYKKGRNGRRGVRVSKKKPQSVHEEDDDSAVSYQEEKENTM